MKRLQDYGILRDLQNDCGVCEMESEQCDELRDCVQSLMNQGVIQFTKLKVNK